jgi:hypothetical protein
VAVLRRWVQQHHTHDEWQFYADAYSSITHTMSGSMFSGRWVQQHHTHDEWQFYADAYSSITHTMSGSSTQVRTAASHTR